MTIRTQLRAVATASLLALTIMSLPAAQAYAAPNTTSQGRCEADGGVWDPKKGCATKACTHEGGYYRHGDTVTTVSGSTPGHIKLRQLTTYKCNGFTGQWEQVSITAAPQSDQPAQADVPVLSR